MLVGKIVVKKCVNKLHVNTIFKESFISITYIFMHFPLMKSYLPKEVQVT